MWDFHLPVAKLNVLNGHDILFKVRCTKQQKIMRLHNQPVNQPTPLYRIFKKLVIPYLVKKIPTFKRILKKHYQCHMGPPLSQSTASLNRPTPHKLGLCVHSSLVLSLFRKYITVPKFSPLHFCSYYFTGGLL